MNPEQADKLANMVGDAASKIGLEAVRIWPEMVKMTFIQSLASFILGWLVTVVFLKMTFNLYQSMSKKEYQNISTLDGCSLIVLVILSVFMFLVAAGNTPGNLPGIFTPEAATVMRLLGK